MIEIIPKLDYLCVECPIYNGEWMVCNITKNKCPKRIEQDDTFDITDFPDDCPAKKGITVKLKD